MSSCRISEIYDEEIIDHLFLNQRLIARALRRVAADDMSLSAGVRERFAKAAALVTGCPAPCDTAASSLMLDFIDLDSIDRERFLAEVARVAP